MLIDPFFECMANKEMAGYTYLLFVSIIQRATVYVYPFPPLSTAAPRSRSVPACSWSPTC